MPYNKMVGALVKMAVNIGLNRITPKNFRKRRGNKIRIFITGTPWLEAVDYQIRTWG
jgi:hypothetical protein